MAWKQGTGEYIEVEFGRAVQAVIASNLPTEAWHNEQVWITRAFASKIWTLEK